MSLADKLIEIERNVPKVYEAGKQSANIALWGSIQKGGARTNYSNAFAQTNYTKDTFLPIYDIRPTGSLSSMFYQSNTDANGTTVTFDMAIDMVEVEQKQGIVFDTSAVTSMYMAFAGNPFLRLNTIDATSATDLTYAFYGGYGSRLKRIEHFICSEVNTFHSTTFQSNAYLEHIGFEGRVGKSGLDLSTCPVLDKATFVKLIPVLSTTTSGLSITLSRTAVNTAFETSTGAADGSTSDEWAALVATRSNWTIILA